MAVQYLYGNEVASEFAANTQVYEATHDRVGKRLPYRNRSFISFSFGGKIIEDFNLIAITDGDRLNRNIYTNFEDVTETYEAMDGQTYWGTHLTNNQLDLVLTTDGITEKQLDEFKQWFAPGKTRELILAEHPNRAIMARVAAVPQMSILPFKHTSQIKVIGKMYNTEITLYKGNISLSFVMDEPYWYAKYNIIKPYMHGEGANGVLDITQDPYRLKSLLLGAFLGTRFGIEYRSNNKIVDDSIVIEDMNITEEGYWKLTGVMGNDQRKTLQYPDEITSLTTGALTLETEDKEMANDAKDFVKIVLEDNIPYLQMIRTAVLLGEDIGANNGDDQSRVFNNTNASIGDPPLLAWHGARVRYYGYVGLDATTWAQSVSIDISNPQYLFYSGTAPSKPLLKFTFIPTFNSAGYVNLPRNQYSHPDEVKEGDYNYIAFDDNYFKFTTPSLITGYNQAINIVKNFAIGGAFTDLIMALKENINEYYARAWAIFCAKSLVSSTSYVSSNSAVQSAFAAEFIKRMKYLICSNGTTANPITCAFNSKTGVAEARFTIRAATINPEGATLAQIAAIPQIEIEENVGDMAKSDYLIIDGRNYPSSEGYITERECHIITTDFTTSNPLTGLLVTFQNMYY